MFVVPVLPPSFILRQNRRLAGTVELGFDKAYRTAYKGWKPQWDESEFILPKAYGDKKFTVELVLKTLKSMAGAEVCFDVETDGRHVLNNDLRCIGFYDGKVGITVPLLYRDGSRQDVTLPDGTVENRAVWKPFWTPAEWSKVSSAIAQLLSGEGKLSAALAITQNGQYDRSVLRSQRASLRRAAPELPLDLDVPAGASGFTFDTLVAHHVIAPYLPHDLGFLAAMYTDAPYYKSSASGDAWSSAGDYELWLYCLRDVKATWLIAQKMKREVREVYPRAQAIFEHDTWHEQECERWRERGLHVHRPTLRYFRWRFSRMRDRAMKRMEDLIAARLEAAKSKEQLKGELSNAEGKLDETKAHALLELVSRLSGKLDFDEFEEEENREKHRAAQMAEAFNPNSLRELRALLLALGVPLTEVTKTGELSTAKELLTAARKELVAKGVAPSDDRVAFLDYLFAFRESSKMVSTFLVPEVLGDGKLHATFGVHRVPTGRLHSSDPNLMNQPQEIRGMYVADEADWLEDSMHVIVAEDWDAGEMRLGAFLSDDPEYVKVFKEYDAGTGPKPHFMNMNAIFGLPPTKAAAEQNPGPYRAAKVFIYACLAGGTKVALLNGEKPIETVEPGDLVWCWDGRKYVPAPVKRRFEQGVRSTVTLTLRDQVGNRKTLTVTPDHKMFLRDGSTCRADELKPKDRLMPFRRYQMKSGYMEIDPFNDGTRAYEHRWVAECVGRLGEHVHHLDEDRTNNRPENLAPISNSDHQRLHGTIARPDVRERAEAGASKATIERWSLDHDGMNAKLVDGRKNSPWWQKKAAEGAERLERARLGREKWIAAGRPRGAKSCYACAKAVLRALAQGLCPKCYRAVWKAEKPNHIVERVEVGPTVPVFDIEVDHPAHNFALSEAGITVSNCAYGAGENTVYEQVREEMPDMAFAAFKIAFGNLKKRYPQFFKWQADNVKMVSRRGHYDSPLKGRRMFFFELSFDGEGSPEATVIANAPFQSGLADIVSEANKRVERDVVPKWKKLMLPAGAKKAEILKRWKGATLEGKDHKPEPIVLSAKQVELLQRYGERCHQFAQVHDELPYVVPKRIADEFVKELKAVSGMKPVREELQSDGTVKLIEQDWNMPADPHHSWRWKPVQETCGSMEVWLKVDGKDEKGKPIVKRLKKFVAAEKACKELVDIELVYGSEVEWRGECGKCGTKKVVIVEEEKS